MSKADSHKTTDHKEIKKWAEARGGTPAIVKSTLNDEGSAILRVDFPGFSGEDTLEEVSWDRFFEIFEEQRLAFLYQDQTANRKPSRFNKFVRRD